MAQVQYKVVWPPINKSMIALIVAFAVLWLGSLQGAPLHDIASDYLLLSMENVTERTAVWSALTYAFFQADFFGILFAGIAVWLFGGELANRWSPLKFWGMQVAAIVVGGLVCLAALAISDSALTVKGYQAAAMALVFAYCWRMWTTRTHFFFFEMTGRTMLLLFLGLGVLGAIFSGYWPSVVLDLAGILVGFLVSTGLTNLRDLRTRFRMRQARKNLTLVKSPEEKRRPPRKNADGMYIN